VALSSAGQLPRESTTRWLPFICLTELLTYKSVEGYSQVEIGAEIVQN
jgi:hypothetical protein